MNTDLLPVYLDTSIFSLWQNKMSPPSGGRTKATLNSHKDLYNNKNNFDFIHTKHLYDDELYNV